MSLNRVAAQKIQALYDRSSGDNISTIVTQHRDTGMRGNLRNFDLSVEEIRIVRMMDELVEGLERLEFNDPLSPRADFFRTEINKLEEKLEQIRDNTLIR